MIVGYARVSTQNQDLSAQLEALKKAGAARIYREKISGAKADRPELGRLMRGLERGDILDRHPPRSTGTLNTRSAQRARRRVQSRRSI